METNFDVIVIGGGQSGLASAYYLRRHKLSYIVLDSQPQCGGAWNSMWDSLTLFSPAEHSSLPGWPMPASENKFPLKSEVIDYFCRYEQRYEVPLERPVRVEHVTKQDGFFSIETDKGIYRAKAIIAATGTYGHPLIPEMKGRASFKGIQLHSSQYRNPQPYAGRKVLVVGEGNSGAQLVAELSKVATVKWATRKTPQFLPDHVDGYYLFNAASAKYHAEKNGEPFDAQQYSLGNIVIVPAVKDAREREALLSSGIFNTMYDEGVIWDTGDKEAFDIILWCTGFGYDTGFLSDITEIDSKGIIPSIESRSLQAEGLWLVGYGNWAGYAAATLIGVNRSAKQAVSEIVDYLNTKNI